MAAIILYTESGKTYKTDDSMEIHRGGEGRIMALSSFPDLVAKLYHTGKTPISPAQMDFLMHLDSSVFVAPQEIVKNKKGDILGFTMMYLGREYFPLSNLFSKNYCILNSIDDDFKKKIAEQLIKAVEIAHKNQVLLGDLNQYNVLINFAGDLKMIDTDSYGTPAQSHSEILLDDIRDYLYGGHVSEQSDFFALAVLIFYKFTFSHPFKGIHKKLSTLAERMIHKIPVFIDDPNLIQPKVYSPISDTNMQNQFHRIFAQGERFMFSVSGANFFTQLKKPSDIKKIEAENIEIVSILPGTEFINMMFSQNTACLETQDNFLIFDASQRGSLNRKTTISKLKFSNVYLTADKIYLRKENKLFLYQSDNNITEIINFIFPEGSFTQIYENILCIIATNTMYTVYLDEIFNNSIKVKRTEVFDRSFSVHSGVFQNIGGIYRYFYNTGKDLAIVKTDFKLKKIVQIGFVGMMQYIDSNIVKNNYFRIQGLDIQLGNEIMENIPDFAYMASGKGNGYIAEPDDNKILIRRIDDFQIVSQLECPIATRSSKLSYSKAGISVLENMSIYLINNV
jgi:serine/threonine protein kinase